jgi:hypothetical protein
VTPGDTWLHSEGICMNPPSAHCPPIRLPKGQGLDESQTQGTLLKITQRWDESPVPWEPSAFPLAAPSQAVRRAGQGL